MSTHFSVTTHYNILTHIDSAMIVAGRWHFERTFCLR